MDPELALDAPLVQVEPGGEARARLTVRAGGAEPDRYRLEVLGEAARWSYVEPRHLTAQPGAEGQPVEVVFRPPHTAAAEARAIPFGVRALSLDDRERAAVAEGDLLLAPVRGVLARIDPDRAVGRWGAGYRITLDNRGHEPLRLRLSGVDARKELRFAVAPATPTVAPFSSLSVLLSVRTRRPRLLRGGTQNPFVVEYREADGPRTTSTPSVGRLRAVFDQRAVLPAPVAALVGIAVAVLVLVAAFAATTAALHGLRPAPPVAAPPAPTAAPGAPAPPAGPAAQPIQGFIVIYGPPVPVDDTVNQQVAERFADRLRAAGVPARLVDSRSSEQLDDGLRGLTVVLRDGFADRAAAAAECVAHRDVAPDCVVVAPR